MRNLIGATLSLAFLILVSACSSTQLTQAEAQANAALNAVTATCAQVKATSAKVTPLASGGAANTVASVNSYLNGGCSTAAAIIAIAQDPSTVAWLNGLNDDLNAAVGNAPAATPAPSATPAAPAAPAS